MAPATTLTPNERTPSWSTSSSASSWLEPESSSATATAPGRGNYRVVEDPHPITDACWRAFERGDRAALDALVMQAEVDGDERAVNIARAWRGDFGLVEAL